MGWLGLYLTHVENDFISWLANEVFNGQYIIGKKAGLRIMRSEKVGAEIFPFSGPKNGPKNGTAWRSRFWDRYNNTRRNGKGEALGGPVLGPPNGPNFGTVFPCRRWLSFNGPMQPLPLHHIVGDLCCSTWMKRPWPIISAAYEVQLCALVTPVVTQPQRTKHP